MSDFSDVIYATIKNELKMKWLSRKFKLLDSFSPQKWEVRFTDIEPCLCDKHEWLLHHMRLKNYVSHLITHSHNIAHVNCCTCTYFFPKQTRYQLSKYTCIKATLVFWLNKKYDFPYTTFLVFHSTIFKGIE